MIRCESRCPQPPLPPGMPTETARRHPRFAHLAKPGARCELPAEHEGAHRRGLLSWHAPQLVIRESAYCGTVELPRWAL